MMIAMQYDLGWLVFGIAIIMIISLRSFTAIILMIAAVATLYLLQGEIKEYSMYIMFGLVLLSLLFENKKKPDEQAYGADMSGMGFGGFGGGPMEGGY